MSISGESTLEPAKFLENLEAAVANLAGALSVCSGPYLDETRFFTSGIFAPVYGL
jgi:hypothetical protein